MIEGIVTEDGAPIVKLPALGREWVALVDSGFNGFLELPASFRVPLNAEFLGTVVSNLAGGKTVVEDSYSVDFPFDGRTIRAVATFVDGDEILLGTQMLKGCRLEIDFPARTVRIERVGP